MKLKILVLLSGLLILGLMSCSDDKDVDPSGGNGKGDGEQTEVENPYKTGVDLSKSYTLKSGYVLGDEEYSVLGYGYDMTGKYAHPAYVKASVVDVEKCLADDTFDYYVDRRGVFYHRGTGYIYGGRQEFINECSQRIKMPELAEHKNVMKDFFDLTFENDTSFNNLEYYYAYSSFTSSWYSYSIDIWRVKGDDFFEGLLTNGFEADLLILSGDEIVKKYGTHVLLDIETGWREDFIFRASSEKQLEVRMLYASAEVFEKTSGMWVSPGPNKYLDKENIYHEMVGSTSPFVNAWMVDLTNSDRKLVETEERGDMKREDCVLVNHSSRLDENSLLPIYKVVHDKAKKKEVQEAFEKYLSE